MTVAGTASSAILLAVEQPIGQNVTPTTPAAGTDPAFFPGIVPPQSAAPGSEPAPAEDAIPAALRGSAARKPKADDTAGADEAPEAAGDSEPAAAAEAEDAEPADAEADTDSADTADDDEDADDGKPVFEASDRRAGISADRHGVTFTLDGETAEFGWDEIGAVEVDSPRFGKRFSVTVYTSARRWFQCDVEAPSRSALKQWGAELDAVLDARFDDEKPEAEEPEEPAAETADADADSEEQAEDEKAAAKSDEKSEDGKAEAKDSASADA